MGDDLFRTEQELRLFRLDLEEIRRHGQRIAFCLPHIKLGLRQIVPHLLLLEAEERQIKACLLPVKRQEEQIWHASCRICPLRLRMAAGRRKLGLRLSSSRLLFSGCSRMSTNFSLIFFID
jgi:hypothetical protein